MFVSASNFLGVVLIGLGVDQPVDVLGVIPRSVFAVFAELDRKALERAGVKPLQEALYDELGAEVETRDLPNDLGLQILLDCRHTRVRPKESPGI